MKKTIILIVLLALVFPVFSQGTMEVVADKGIIGAYKSLINYKEGVYVPEEEKKEEIPVVEEASTVIEEVPVVVEEVSTVVEEVPVVVEEVSTVVEEVPVVVEEVSTVVEEVSTVVEEVPVVVEEVPVVVEEVPVVVEEVPVVVEEVPVVVEEVPVVVEEVSTVIEEVPVKEEKIQSVETSGEKEAMMEAPEREGISFPTSDAIEDGVTNVTNYFADLPEDEVYITIYSHNGVKLAGAFTKNEAVIIVPRGIVPESVSTFTSYLSDSVPEFSDVVFSSEIDKLVLTYPDKTMDEIVSFCGLLTSEAEKFIDRIALRRTESSSALITEVKDSTLEDTAVIKVEAANVDVKGGAPGNEPTTIPLGLGEENEVGDFTIFDDVVIELATNQTDVYEVEFAHNGVKTRGAFTKNKAVLMIPRGITGESIDEFAKYLLENYPVFGDVYFSGDFDKLILTYPDKSMDEIIAFSDLLFSEAEKFIDSIALSRTSSSAAVISTSSESTETAKVVDVVEAPVAPVAPVAEEKKNSIFTFSAGFNIGLQGLFTSDKNAVRFFPTIGGDMRLYAWKFIFAEGGGDMMIYKNSSKLIINGALRAVGGLSLMGSNFGVVAYGGAMYLFTSENSVFTNGFSVIYGVGLEFDFAGHISLKAAYEHYDNKNLYNVSIGYRF